MASSTKHGYLLSVDPDTSKLSEEIELSRKEIAKLQERVRQLVARRGKRAELVKAAHTIASPELPDQPVVVTRDSARAATEDEDAARELSLEEGLAALKSTTISDVRLIAFKHGAVILLFADEKTLTIRMDERGPKPLLDLLSANDHSAKENLPAVQPYENRARA